MDEPYGIYWAAPAAIGGRVTWELETWRPVPGGRAEAQVRAALAEGFCPSGHPLTHGGGTWGACYPCKVHWTAPAGGRCTWREIDAMEQLGG